MRSHASPVHSIGSELPLSGFVQHATFLIRAPPGPAGAPFCPSLLDQRQDHWSDSQLMHQSMIHVPMRSDRRKAYSRMQLDIYEQWYRINAGFEQVLDSLKALRRNSPFDAGEVDRFRKLAQEARAATNSYLASVVERAEKGTSGPAVPRPSAPGANRGDRRVNSPHPQPIRRFGFDGSIGAGSIFSVGVSFETE